MLKFSIKYIICSCLLLLNFKSFSQKIEKKLEGNVKDGLTKKPIIDVSVLTQSSDGKDTLSIVKSDSQGKFEFMIADSIKEFITTFSHVNYSSESLKVSRDMFNNPLEVILTEGRDIDEVVVVKKRNPFVQKVDRLEIDINQLTSQSTGNLFEVLNSLPGVQLEEDGQMSLRGIEGLKILIDDKQVYLSGTDLINYLKSLPKSSAELVEIMTNPPAKYAADGSAGILNIRMKKGKKESGVNGVVNLAYNQGKFGKSNNNILLNYKKNKVNIVTNFGYSSQSNYFDVSRNRYWNDSSDTVKSLIQKNYESNRANVFSSSTTMDYQISDKSNFSINYNGFWSKYSEDGDYASTLFHDKNPHHDNFSVSDLTNRTSSNSLNGMYIYNFGKNESLSFNVDYLAFSSKRKQSLDNDIFNMAPNSSDEFYNLYSNNPFKAKILGVKLDFDSKTIFNIDFNSGLQVTRSARKSIGNYMSEQLPSDYINSLNNIFNYDEQIQAAYVSLSGKVTERFEYKLGLRAERTEFDSKLDNGKELKDDYLNLFPTVYGLFKLDTANSSSLYISLGKRISRPSYQDLNPSIFFFDKNTTYQGNTMLTPQYAYSAEIGYFRGRILSMSLSYNKTKDNISQVYFQDNSVYSQTYYNIDWSEAFSAQINSSIALTNFLESSIFLQLSNIRYKGRVSSVSESIIDNSQFTFRINNYNSLKLGNDWKLDVTNSFRTTVLFAQTRIKPLYQMHLGVSRKINDRFSLAASVRDVFHSNKMVRDIAGENVYVNSETIVDSRTIGVTLTYSFGRSFKEKRKATSISEERERL
jgi:hypothetical protein